MIKKILASLIVLMMSLVPVVAETTDSTNIAEEMGTTPAETSETPAAETTTSGGYTDVRVRFTYKNYYIDFPKNVNVGNHVILYYDQAKQSVNVDWTVPATGYEDEALKQFAEVGNYDKEGYTLKWGYDYVNGDLLIWPIYTPVADPNAPTNGDETKTYAFNFK